jgi:PAS domain S-box-containing protein
MSSRHPNEPRGSIAAFGSDITEHKIIEQTLLRQKALLLGISRIFHEALTCQTEEELGEVCLRVAEEITESRFGFIGEIKGQHLEEIAISNPGWDACAELNPHGQRKPPGKFELHGIYGRVLLDGKSFFTNDPTHHPDRVGLRVGHPPLESFLGAPLIHEGRTIGMIALANRPGGYTPSEQESVEALTPVIVEAFMRKRAEQALMESEKRFHRLFEDDLTGDFVCTPEGKILLCNPAFAAIFGFSSPDEVIGTSFLDLYVDPGERESMLESLKQQGNLWRYETWRKRRDGELIYVVENIVGHFNDRGELFEMQGYIFDDTERKQAEIALQESKKLSLERAAHLQSTLDAAPSIIWTAHDCECRSITGNRAAEEFTRVPQGADMSKTGPSADGLSHYRVFKDGVELKPEEMPIQRVAASGIPLLDHAIDFVFDDGTVRALLGNVVPVLDEKGQSSGAVAAFMDITERKRAEEELRESEVRLKRSQEIARLGSWELDLLNQRLTWSDEVYRIFGLQPQEVGATYEAFLDAVHPDDRAAVDAAYSGSVREGRDAYEIEHRIVRKSTGEIRIVHEKCEHIRDASGLIIRSLGMVHDITERKRADDALHDAHHRALWLARFPDENPNPVLRVSADRRVLYCNPSAEELPGWTCGVGQSLDSRLLPLVNRAMSGGQEEQDDVHIGSRVYSVWVTPFPEEGYANVYGLDITERKQAEEALTKAEKKYRELVQYAPAGIYEIDFRTRRFTSVNDAMCQMAGYSREELLTMDVFDLLDEASQALFQARIARWLSGEEPDKGVEYRVRAKDGHTLDVILNVTFTRDKQGKPLGATVVGHDITERKLMEEELRKSRDELEMRVRERTAELEMSNKELQDFAFVASHDLNEPLRKIQAFGDMVTKRLGDFKDEDSKDYLKRMQTAAARMKTLLNSLLSYSRVTTKAEPMKKTDLRRSVKEALSNLEIPIGEKNAKVEIGDLPTIKADVVRMTQLFQNLIGNALKFHREGEAPHVKIYSKEMEDAHEIYVEDNGIGFDEKYLDKIFEPFQRLHGRSSEYEGVGMGLAICKKIVERHGGKITARSEAGKGSTFIVTLPVERTAP